MSGQAPMARPTTPSPSSTPNPAREQTLARVPTGLFRQSEAARAGVSARSLYRLRDAGLVEVVGRGLYRRAGGPPVDEDLAQVAARSPRATVCLSSALARHGLIDAIPARIHVAIPRGSYAARVQAPVRWHVFDAATFDLGRQLLAIPGADGVGGGPGPGVSAGDGDGVGDPESRAGGEANDAIEAAAEAKATEHTARTRNAGGAAAAPATQGVRIGLYSAERSIVDVFRLRGQEGYEVGVEALRAWLRRPGAHPAALLALATQLPRAQGPLRQALEYLA